MLRTGSDVDALLVFRAPFAFVRGVVLGLRLRDRRWL